MLILKFCKMFHYVVNVNLLFGDLSLFICVICICTCDNLNDTEDFKKRRKVSHDTHFSEVLPSILSSRVKFRNGLNSLVRLNSFLWGIQ